MSSRFIHYRQNKLIIIFMISKFEDPWFRIATVKCAPFYHGKGDFKLVFKIKYMLLHYILTYVSSIPYKSRPTPLPILWLVVQLSLPVSYQSTVYSKVECSIVHLYNYNTTEAANWAFFLYIYKCYTHTVYFVTSKLYFWNHLNNISKYFK